MGSLLWQILEEVSSSVKDRQDRDLLGLNLRSESFGMEKKESLYLSGMEPQPTG